MGAARKGLAALEIRWDEGANTDYSTEKLIAALASASSRTGAVARKEGDTVAAARGAARTVDAVYQQPLLAQAPMEPVNCTVHVRPDACEVARPAVPPALSEGRSRRIAHAGALGPGGDGRRGDGAPRSGTVADLAGQPRARGHGLALPARRPALLAGAVHRAPPSRAGRPRDPAILRFERWARDNLEQGFSLDTAARALATSPRTLQRRCQAVLGKSPLAYIQDLRIERARSLVHGSDLEAIAAEVGYADGSTLGALLRERLGRGVRDLRADLL
jgi:AraC-like DNA-binding protein